MIEQASLVIGEGNWAVKSDSLLGYKINGGKYYPREMSVVRATTGTRINEDGLVEVVPYNLVQYSQDFSNAYWYKNNVTITTNDTTAPDGTLTADKMSASTTSANYINEQTGFNLVCNRSIYAKAGNHSQITILWNPFSNGKFATFDLSNGTVSYGGSGITATIENVGNGWYRCSTNGSENYPYLITLNGVNNSSISVGSYVYIWGAQIVEGSSALDYLPTTDRLDVARIDYSSGSAALLVEPQRTNLALYSSSFDNAAWAKENATITANSVISPDGTQNADTLTDDAVNGRHRFQTYFTGTAGTSYTLSIYVKKNSANRFLLLNAQSIIGQKSVLNLDTLQITNLNGASGQVVDAGNGWYRFSVSGTYITASNYYIQMQNSASDVSYVGDGSSFYLWGAQLEAGSYPTSLIPTQGSTVTRNADVISKTGIADLIGQTEGTVFIDTYIDNISAQTNDPVLIFLRGTSVETYIQVYDNGSARVVHYNGTTQCNIQSSSGLLTNGRHKFAFGYKDNDFVFYIDGVLIGTDTSGSVGAQNELSFQFYISSFYGMQNVNSTALWKTRLTNAELATLTTI